MALVAGAAGAEEEALLVSTIQPRREQPPEQQPHLAAAGGGGRYEIVIARYEEWELAWVAELPSWYEITVYNKGGEKHPMPPAPEGVSWTVVELPNVGREPHSFATHLVMRYDSLADYTVFSQADPFTHNLHFLQLAASPALLGSVQTMSRVYKRDGDPRYATPLAAVERMSKHPWYRSERFSLRTMNSVWYHDEGTAFIERNYRVQHGLEPGTNLIHHFFGLIGLPQWVPEEQEVGSFAMGGILGFERSRALQHPRHCYELLLNVTQHPMQPGNAWVIERVWLILFGGAHYRDV